MATEFLKIENKAKLRKIIINNPRKRNALSVRAYEELTDALNHAAADKDVSICAITGEGEYYSSGNDLAGFLRAEDPLSELQQSKSILGRMIKAFYEFPKPLICVINGPCIGIAATTAALADVIYSSEKAYFYTPFSLLGLCVEGCASHTFPRILGKSKASEMLLFNHKLSAKEAHQLGLVSEVFSDIGLRDILWPRIESFSMLSEGSLLSTKKILQRFNTKELDEVLEVELDELYRKFDQPEFMEALAKFLERKSKL